MISLAHELFMSELDPVTFKHIRDVINNLLHVVIVKYGVSFHS